MRRSFFFISELPSTAAQREITTARKREIRGLGSKRSSLLHEVTHPTERADILVVIRHCVPLLFCGLVASSPLEGLERFVRSLGLQPAGLIRLVPGPPSTHPPE